VIKTSRGLALIRDYYNDETCYMFRIVLNSTSALEANIALELLLKSVPDRALICAVNMRELFKSLPAPPFAMAVDEETLTRVAGLEKNMAALEKGLEDGNSVIVTTAGNLVLDLIVRDGDVKHFWTPTPITSDFMNPDLIELVLFSDYLLESIVDLFVAMGVPVHPNFFMSLEDWCLENATEAMRDLQELF